ncbi:putative peptidase M28 family protein [Lyophyllum shimeji]|uniref:Peptide hydrolase n=1 Tax=Lyophyllum shimeji TaxID=47721 RepID=A0A9P3PRY3_LYOSH|nr:putative peptidase M28 family protein [Lyophyllum shimeji]
MILLSGLDPSCPSRITRPLHAHLSRVPRASRGLLRRRSWTPFVPPVFARFNKLTPAKFDYSIRLDNLLGHSNSLWKFATLPRAGTTRAFGTKGYNASADYVARLARDHGYQVERQTLVYRATTVVSNCLKITDADIPKSEIIALQYSASASLTAPLILARIWAVTRRTRMKGQLAKAAAFFSVTTFQDLLSHPASQPPRNQPASALPLPGSRSSHRGSIDEAITATLDINVVNEYRAGDNGAHLDSVPAVAGNNDDGSGTATIFELAIQPSMFSGLKNAIRFAWWTAEEVGLIGSRFYVAHLPVNEKANIFANINLDMTARTNYISGDYDGDNSTGLNTGVPAPPGSAAIEKLYQIHYTNMESTTLKYAFTSGSDYRPSLDAGIPQEASLLGQEVSKSACELALFGGQEACKTLDNLAHEAYLWNARASTDVIAHLLTFDAKVILKDPPRTKLVAGVQEFDYAADLADEYHRHLDEL